MHAGAMTRRRCRCAQGRPDHVRDRWARPCNGIGWPGGCGTWRGSCWRTGSRREQVVIRALPSSRNVGSARLEQELRAGLRRASSRRVRPVSAVAAHWLRGAEAAVVRGMIFLIQLYRHMVSPLRLPTCRFTPTCSQYAVDALTEYGLMRGSWLAAVRLAKCGRGIGEDGIRYRSATAEPGSEVWDTPATLGESDSVCLIRSASTIVYYPVSAIMWLWYKAFAAPAGPDELLRLGAVGDVPGVHVCGRFCTSRSSARSAPPGRCRSCSRRSRRCRRSTARTASGWRWRCRSCRREHGFNPDPRLPADAGADPGVPRAVSRAAVLQPDHQRHRAAGTVAEREPRAGQLRLQRHRRRTLPGRQPVRRAARRDHDAARREPRGVHRFQPARR